MKKKLISLIILIIFSLFYLYGFGVPSLSLLTGGATTINSFVQDQGEIQLYFCPHEQCDVALDEFLKTAKESIHCAFFELDLENLQQTILEKQKVMDVKVVTDEQYLYEFDHDFVKVDKWGLMHNKFCIVDDYKISTGSMNPTNNGAFKNNNNLLIIESTTLATNYEQEFQEMWNGTFKKGDKVLNPFVKVGNVKMANYFCPEDSCADKVRAELEKAQSSIDFMTFSFTHESIANMILLKYTDGIKVRGIFEARQVSKYSQYERLKFQGMDVFKDGNKNNMHHKVFIVDNRTVITGSFNPSGGGDTRNDENILMIENEEIVKEFLDEFERVYKERKK